MWLRALPEWHTQGIWQQRWWIYRSTTALNVLIPGLSFSADRWRI